jgi:hypothetical protein
LGFRNEGSRFLLGMLSIVPDALRGLIGGGLLLPSVGFLLGMLFV